MEIRFTASVIMAINAMDAILHGEIKGAEWSLEPSEAIEVEAPRWDNFRFYHRIRAAQIRWERLTVKAGEEYCWKPYRRVEFFYRGRLVAFVELSGQAFDDQHDSDSDIDPCIDWRVSRVKYYRSFGSGDAYPSHWYGVRG